MHTAAPPESAHLLVVDDQPEGLVPLTRLLAERYRLSYAADGQRGYQRALHLQPDLILLDLDMPESDGFAACRLLKSDPKTRAVPVIFLSAHGAAAQRREGLQLGAVDYVVKPFDPVEVALRVGVHLRLARRDPPDGDEAGPPEPVAPRHPDAVIVQAAVRYIHEHLDDLPGHAEIARSVGTHEKRLVALFREHYGLAVSAYVAEQRVSAGRRLLAETTLSVQDIAQQVGFRNPGNFATAFKARYGLTPMAYRRTPPADE